MTTCEVTLDETDGEANGAAYLVHMLLSQKAEADKTGGFAKEAARLRPVGIWLTDTEEGAVVKATPGGLVVESGLNGHNTTTVTATSNHVIVVTKLALLGRFAIFGPPRSKEFKMLIKDLVSRKVVVKGLISHYLNTRRFLWLVNLHESA